MLIYFSKYRHLPSGCKPVFLYFIYLFLPVLVCFHVFPMQTNEGAHIMYLGSTLYNDGSFVLFCDQLKKE